MADSSIGAEKTAATANPAIQAGAAPRSPISSSWATLGHELFRVLWIASVASNVGTMMQEVGASWLMTQLAPSPLMVALIQTAGALPVFLLSLVSGALADIVDRRRLLIFSQAWMLVAAAGLGILTVFHLTSPLILLNFTFLLGLGNALTGPAWNAIVPELVPRAEVGAAVSINSVGYNVARAAGPALGGLVVAAVGSGAVFLLNAASFLGVIVVFYRWHRKPRKSVMPTERVVGAMRAGWRYVAHAPAIRSTLFRLSLFMLGASAFWGLVPLFARQHLGRGAAGYGVLLGFFGTGAVMSGSILPRMQRWLGIKRLLISTTLLTAGALVLMALWRHFPVACAAAFAAGVAWTAAFSTFNTSVQLNTAAWVRGRVMAFYQLTYFAALGVGSALWGTVAEHVGIPRSLLVAAVALAVGLFAVARYPVDFGEGLNLAPSYRPIPVVMNEPQPEQGPVLITVEYRIDPQRAGEFTSAMLELGRFRRRDGAVDWGLFEDVAEQGRYLETFVVESWGEHLRQHERTTVADRQISERANSFHLGDTPPTVSHHLYAYHQEA
ncbi:MAG: MFS transporter [Acidobacteriota bacterium]|nr:MFS transporter [Acidobacteriota bacterium]